MLCRARSGRAPFIHQRGDVLAGIGPTGSTDERLRRYSRAGRTGSPRRGRRPVGAERAERDGVLWVLSGRLTPVGPFLAKLRAHLAGAAVSAVGCDKRSVPPCRATAALDRSGARLAPCLARQRRPGCRGCRGGRRRVPEGCRGRGAADAAEHHARQRDRSRDGDQGRGRARYRTEASDDPAPDRSATGCGDRCRARRAAPAQRGRPGMGGVTMPRPVEPGRWRPQHATREYQRLRRAILDARGWRCEECGRAGRLELHHVNGDRDDDRPDNLRILCRPCHFTADGRRSRTGPDRLACRDSAPAGRSCISVRYDVIVAVLCCRAWSNPKS